MLYWRHLERQDCLRDKIMLAKFIDWDIVEQHLKLCKVSEKEIEQYLKLYKTFDKEEQKEIEVKCKHCHNTVFISDKSCWFCLTKNPGGKDA